MYTQIVSFLISLRKCDSFGKCRMRENQYKCDVMVIEIFEARMGQQMRLAKLKLRLVTTIPYPTPFSPLWQILQCNFLRVNK